MKPVKPDMKQPTTKAGRTEQSRLGEAERLGSIGPQHRGGGDKHHHHQWDQNEEDRAELPPQIGHRPFLDRRGDLSHFRSALIGRDHSAGRG